MISKKISIHLFIDFRFIFRICLKMVTDFIFYVFKMTPALVLKQFTFNLEYFALFKLLQYHRFELKYLLINNAQFQELSICIKCVVKII